MKALTYDIKPAGWLVCRLLRRAWPGCLTSRLNGLRLVETEPPALPGDDWVRVRTRLGGVCGTDLAILAQRQPVDSILQAYSSMPIALGHENVAIVEEVGLAVDDAWIGKRVTVDPTLGCEARGIDPPCGPCSRGEYGACENFDGGGRYDLPAGTSIGYNARTGGSWGEKFVAHKSQLVEVPEGLTDEAALMTDPVACSLHGLLRVDMDRVRRVLVYGAGVLGQGLVALLRARGFDGQVDILTRGRHLADVARLIGNANPLHLTRRPLERFEAVAERTGGRVLRVRFGNLMLAGGYDAVFDCQGSRQSLEEALKWTAGRGQVCLVATASAPPRDLTPLWFRELTVHGVYGRQLEHADGRRVATYRLVHELMSSGGLDVSGLVTHTFRLGEYRRALAVGLNKARHSAIKTAFDFR